ncbi:hypothetical protein [Variovorax paradoxus]|nr:hypothetical protein RZE77_03060 [Variovorax paradoxus]
MNADAFELKPIALASAGMLIDPRFSQDWLREVESYLNEVDSLLKDVPLK